MPRFTDNAGWIAICLSVALWSSICNATAPSEFDKTIAPILKAKCFKCHSDGKRKGGLDLRTPAAILQGGDSGPAIISRDAAKSILLQRILSKEMPPKEEPALTDAEIATIRQWIEVGVALPMESAKATPAGGRDLVTEQDRQHWAFLPLSVATRGSRVGSLKEDARGPRAPRNPVDAFILEKLQSHDLSLSPEADRNSLIRRVTLDLLGLPPLPEEVSKFVADPRDNAYELLVDRLLASPQFGERWGRQWLDNVGYVDVIGTDNDAGIISLGENKWMYRDYVVRAINADKPFDRFVTEQLAGDELVDWRSAPQFTDEIRELLIATGFLRISSDDTQSMELNLPLIRHSVLQHTGEAIASNLLALTVNCAKCHDHKYEPIPQQDYYQFLAILQPALNPDNWLQPNQRQLPAVSPNEKGAIEKRNADIDEQCKVPQQQLATLRRPYEEKLVAQKLNAVPEQIRADTKTAVDTPAEKRTDIQKYLVEKFAASLQVKPEEVPATLSDADKATQASLEKQIADLKAQKRSWENWQVIYDVGAATPTKLLKRGNHETPGQEVKPAGLSVLCTGESNTELNVAGAAGQTSGRRLALAKWLTDVKSPAGALVLRVRVNRIWQQLFGKGLVESADNFGKSGTAPSHPELLEWLAGEFAANGQQLKPLIKMLVTSNVYRQASIRVLSSAETDPTTVDPGNRLLWRMPLRRLESEAVRDALLAVSGQLDTTIGGPPVPVESKPDGTFVVPEKGLPTKTSQFRRSLYLLARRNYHPTLLGVFDQPTLTSNCTGRSSSAVVLQSLTMLNDPFVLQQAAALGERVSHSGSQTAERVANAFQITLNRVPKSTELQWCLELVKHHQEYYVAEKQTAEAAETKAIAHLCHMLFNTSEFLAIP